MQSAMPWVDEPDEFALTAYGLPVRGQRGPLGAWCGYVGVPPSHPLFGLEPGDAAPVPPGWKDRAFDADEYGVVNLFFAASSYMEWGEGYAPLNMIFGAHGGLNFASKRSDDAHWYFGFDCAHAGDLVPILLDQFGIEFAMTFGTYRTIDFVRGECVQLAEQLSAYAGGFNGQIHTRRHHVRN